MQDSEPIFEIKNQAFTSIASIVINIVKGSNFVKQKRNPSTSFIEEVEGKIIKST
jgi:hypothetical protein